ncbi:MAG: hypothetical protein ABIR18_00915 [Chitinophagaceae bacterium]
MRLLIAKDRSVENVQQEFNSLYPFLKLEFYKLNNDDADLQVKRHLPHSTMLTAAGLRNSGDIEVSDEMTVAQLEKTFRKQFGLDAQVCRKSGILWLQTTMTDNWSLQKQNEHGREISLTAKTFPGFEG